MTDTYKVLGQALTGDLALDGTTVKETVVYEVPAGTKASVSSVEITNSDVASQTYKVAFVPSADVSSSTTTLNYNVQTLTDGFVTTAFESSLSAYSTDGINWTETTMPQFGNWRTAYGNGKFVSVSGSSNVAAYSTNGVTWTQTTLPSSLSWRTPVYGNGTFITFAYGSSTFAYSTDGITWASGTMPSSRNWTAAAYGNNKFVVLAYGTNIAAYSPDGIDNWTEATLPDTTNWTTITYGGGKFVAVPLLSNQIAYSTDGISWTQVILGTSAFWNSVAYGAGKFVILATYSTTSLYSSDGITWTVGTTPDFNSTGALVNLTYGNEKFVAVSIYLAKTFYSVDGITWQEGGALGDITNTFDSVVFGALDVPIASQQQIPQSLNKHVAIYNKSIASGETHEIKGGVTLSAGDQIRVYSTSNEIITNVYGVEIA